MKIEAISVCERDVVVDDLRLAAVLQRRICEEVKRCSVFWAGRDRIGHRNSSDVVAWYHNLTSSRPHCSVHLGFLQYVYQNSAAHGVGTKLDINSERSNSTDSADAAVYKGHRYLHIHSHGGQTSGLIGTLNSYFTGMATVLCNSHYFSFGSSTVVLRALCRQFSLAIQLLHFFVRLI